MSLNGAPASAGKLFGRGRYEHEYYVVEIKGPKNNFTENYNSAGVDVWAEASPQ